MKQEQKYVWLDADGYFKAIVTDLREMYRSENFKDTDTLHQLGPEVKLDVVVKVTPVGAKVTGWLGEEK